MRTLPDAIVSLRLPCVTLFTNPTWRKAQVLLVGAILTPGHAPWLRRGASWAAATHRTTPATMRCSIGRCGRLVRRPASCCCCSSTWITATAR